MDPRFDTSKDPRFKRAPRNVRRVEVDGRFAHMFKDKRFVEAPAVDSRGQRLRRNAGKLKLQEFYSLANGDSIKDSAKKGKDSIGKKSRADAEDEVEDDDDELENDDDAEEDCEEEEDEEEDDAEEEEEEDEEEDDDTGMEKSSAVWEAQQEAIPHGDATKRLAVMGCDWDHVAAGDLLVMFRTYLSSKENKNRGGHVEKITVYPSDYGLKQLEREASEGPVMFDEALKGHEDGPDAEKAQQEALRVYQMDRTKYHWALVECDSDATAAWLYDQMDGLEADGICPATLDLRFVPDDLKPPHAPSSEASEIPKKFAGPAMLRSAAAHTKVKCTWDEAPPQRRKDLMRKKFSVNELADLDLKAYLASSSEEEAGEAADDLRALVAGSDSDAFPEPPEESESDDDLVQTAGRKKAAAGKGKKKAQEEMGDMEATFSLKATRLEEELAERAKKQGGGSGVHTLESEEPKSAWQKYLDKRKEKRTEKKQKAKEERDKLRKDAEQPAEVKKKGKQTWKLGNAADTNQDDGDLEVLMSGGKGDARGFNLRGPQRRAHDRGLEADAAGDEKSSFQVDVSDPRIAKVFSSADFEIDPTNPEFRKSEGMNEVLKEKRQRKVNKASQVTKPAPAAASTAPASAVRASKPKPPEKAGSGPSSSTASGLQLFASNKRAAADDAPSLAETKPASSRKKKKQRLKS
eukprot:TRINITY_DN110661_c0_g1_i1.p1 TRINITY_DN110661_c0_g1~~TRINITY_DN110661_c0_g1_i1.p1  ORF type:complete len:704 (-),score=218.30 TRINITY_DN110661_c0_g1_i1:13-2085(-)